MEEACAAQGKKAVGPRKSSPVKSSNAVLRKRSTPSPNVKATVNAVPSKKLKTSPGDLSLKEPLTSPPLRRKSLRRSVAKTPKSLPPVRRINTELCEAINLELPESERFSELLQSCLQFSLQKLEDSLKHSDGFDPKSFDAKVLSVTQKMKRFTERLTRDGTLKKCTEREDSLSADPETEALKAQIGECTLKFSNESQVWEQLLEDYKKKAEDLSRHFEESKLTGTPCASIPRVPTSQDCVLNSKPDYNQILAQQGAVFDCMELVLDELQESVHLLNSFLEETSQHLQRMSSQLSRSRR
uniref:DSN1 homolog, MIS12 kinetochore complex component n=1 Tax=Xenopus tropicalis TaxID=8364 RepID=A0A6I8PSE2_XENTR